MTPERESWLMLAAPRSVLLAALGLALGSASAGAMPPLWIEAENVDGFYRSDAPLDTSRPAVGPPAGPDLIAALNPALGRLPCNTPMALPFSKRKAYVDGAGRVQSLVYRDDVPLGAGWTAAYRGRLGPALMIERG